MKNEQSFGSISKNYFLLDLIRFPLSISVILWHYQYLISKDNSYPLNNLLSPLYTKGFLAVQFFWLVSGFVITHSYINKKYEPKIFVINRIGRLYPLHFLTLLIMLLIQTLSSKILGYSQICTYNNLKGFILNLLFIPAIGFEDGCSYNAPIWSVTLEIYAYIIFIVLFPLLVRFRIMFVSVILVLLINLYIFKDFNIPLRILSCSIFFFFGTFIYFLNNYFRNRTKMIISLIFITAYVIPKKFSLDFGTQQLGKISESDLPLAFLFSGVLLVVVLSETWLKSGRKISLVSKYLGDLTYSSYLLHFPLICFILLIMNCFKINSSSYFSAPASLVVFLFTIIALSRVSYKYFEKPMQNRIKAKFKIL